MHLYLHHYFELLSVAGGVACFNKIRHSYLVWFIPFLIINVVVEIGADYIYDQYAMSTGWIYNTWNVLTQAFYTMIFYKLCNRRAGKTFILLFNIIYTGFCIYYFTAISNLNILNTYIIAAGGIQQVIFCCLFFYQCLQMDAELDGRAKTGLFIASGVMIFYSGVAICLSLYDYIRDRQVMINGIPLYNIIPRYASVILYSLITVSFFAWKGKK
jgi:hypothetical protein